MLLSVAVLSLAAKAIAAPAPAEDGMYHVSLPTARSLHHSDGSLDHEYLLHHLNHTLRKYGAQKLLPDFGTNVEAMLQRRATVASEQLKDAVTDGIDDEVSNSTLDEYRQFDIRA